MNVLSPFSSIKSRVVVSTLAAFLVSLWLLSALTARALEKDISQQVAAAQASAASQMALHLERELSARLQALEQIAGRITAEMISNPASIQQLLEQQPLMHNLFNISVLAVNRLGIGIADAPYRAERIGINYRDRVDAFAVALEEGRANVGTPLIGVSTGQPLIPFAAPVRDDHGTVIGALGGAIDLSRPNFFDDLTGQGYGRTGIYSIVSRSRRIVVTSSNPELIMYKLPEAGVNPVLDRAIRGEEGTYPYTTVLGIESLTTVRGVKVTDWFVAAITPTAEVFAPITDMRQRMTLIALTVTLLVGIGLWWLLRWQLRPMLTTVDTLGEMTVMTGAEKSLPLTGSKEVDVLIAAFNRLLERLTAREEENKRFRTIADIAVYGKAISDLDGNLVYVNRFLAEIHGYTPEELIGKKLTMFHSPEQLDDVAKNLHNLLQDGFFSPRETWHVHRDGRIFPLLMSGVLLKDDQGNPRYLAASAVDITDRHAAEVALKQKNEELEEFVYIVSHDLKSPLITINTFLGMLREDIAANNVVGITEDLGYIKEATGKMENLLNALLQLSRVGRIDAPSQTLPVNKLVDNCLQVLAGSLRRRQVAVTVAEMPWQWHGDPLHFGQIWQNLIENAIKYMGDQPTPRIDIGAEERGGRLVYYVRDNGIGIAPEHHQRIFNIFSQLDRNSPGTGLGLALINKIVTACQGELWVESAGAGQGSCFCFTLPGALVGDNPPPETTEEEGLR